MDLSSTSMKKNKREPETDKNPAATGSSLQAGGAVCAFRPHGAARPHAAGLLSPWLQTAGGEAPGRPSVCGQRVSASFSSLHPRLGRMPS